MIVNVSIWLRAFRPPFQRAYARLEETGRDLAELLRQADERLSEDDPYTEADKADGQR